ncbi:MAG: hypothetical protein Q9191_003249 [Dirinaria sp. TL-2023a]
MAAPVTRMGSSLAAKRARSQDSKRSLTASPVPKAAKTEEVQEEPDVPAFLRQSKVEINTKFQELEWQQSLRIAHGRNDPSSKWTQDMTSQTRFRNRYLNVQPWDKSRIQLKVPEGKSDYINASPISLKDPKTGIETWNYIVTQVLSQGPKQSGLDHFWQMIWHETSETAVIVMLTQTAEAGKEKCFQYFPLGEETGTFRIESTESDETASEGSVELKQTVFDDASRTTIRELIMNVSEERKTVWHLLFSGWPDFDVPEGEDRAALLELLKLSVQKNGASSRPRIIHCSAGVGRSGTFIALEYLLAQVESGTIADAKQGEDLIYDLVNRLREQRMTMVQSDTQYAFLYEVVREQYKKWQLEKASGTNVPTQLSQGLAEGVKTALLGAQSTENGRDKGKDQP